MHVYVYIYNICIYSHTYMIAYVRITNICIMYIYIFFYSIDTVFGGSKFNQSLLVLGKDEYGGRRSPLCFMFEFANNAEE